MPAFTDRHKRIPGTGDIEQHGFCSQRHLLRILNIHVVICNNDLRQPPCNQEGTNDCKKSARSSHLMIMLPEN